MLLQRYTNIKKESRRAAMDKNEFLDKKEALSKEEKNTFWINSNSGHRISRAYSLVIISLGAMYSMFILITICARSRKTFDIITSNFEILYAIDGRTVMFYLVGINSRPHSSTGVECLFSSQNYKT